MTAEIAAAFLETNRLDAAEIPNFIRSIHQTLNTLGQAPAAAEAETTKPTAAQIRKSIKPDALISFEDGRPYRMLKRHLTSIGLTPQQYREKWGLPSDYPMTAPGYSAQRSQLAKSMGLGRKPGETPRKRKAR